LVKSLQSRPASATLLWTWKPVSSVFRERRDGMSLRAAERAGRTPIDHDAGAPAVMAIERLANWLIADAA
jgi:hypothetical protein